MEKPVPTCLTTVVSPHPENPQMISHHRWYTKDIEVSIDGGPIDLDSVSIKISNVDRKVKVYIVTPEVRKLAACDPNAE